MYQFVVHISLPFRGDMQMSANLIRFDCYCNMCAFLLQDTTKLEFWLSH